jgi:PadR family transcriptional regulator
METRRAKHSNDRLQGTLDLLVLKVLARGPLHGYAITTRIDALSGSALQLQEGSLYPALHRMTQSGWLRATWGASENGRRARFYEITATGREQLDAEEENWARLIGAVSRVLKHA